MKPTSWASERRLCSCVEIEMEMEMEMEMDTLLDFKLVSHRG